jgi:hypothetical protein
MPRKRTVARAATEAIAFEPNVFAQSPPRRHRRLLSDDDPSPLATLAQQGVELGATHGDGSAAPTGRKIHYETAPEWDDVRSPATSYITFDSIEKRYVVNVRLLP